jgi:hypothetical protein
VWLRPCGWEHLRTEAFRFKRATRDIKGQMWWRNIKMYFIVLVVLAFLVYIATSQFCDYTLRKCLPHDKHHHSGNTTNTTGATAL